MTFDIPINFKVSTTNEAKAEKLVFDFLKLAMKEFGVEQQIVDFEYFEFVAKESGCSGCGDIHK